MNMSSNETTSLRPLDLSGWRKLPVALMVVGGLLAAVGAVLSPKEFGFSWLLAFMFFGRSTVTTSTLSFQLVREHL